MKAGDMILYTGISSHEEYPNHPIAHKQVIINTKVEIPCPKPSIEYILKVMSEIEIRTTRTVQTPYDFNIIIEGNIHQTFLYSADLPEQPVHLFHACIPFCEFIVLPVECKKTYTKNQISSNVLLDDVYVYNQNSRYIEEYLLLSFLLELNC